MANGRFQEEQDRLTKRTARFFERRQGGQGGTRGAATGDPSGTGATTPQTGLQRFSRGVVEALGGRPLRALERVRTTERDPRLGQIGAALGIGGVDEITSPVERTEAPAQPAGPTVAQPPRQTEFGQEDLEAIQAGLIGRTVPLQQRLGEIESQRSALQSLREAQVAAAQGPVETRPGFEQVTAVGAGGPTAILDEARARAAPRRLQAQLDSIDSAQRRGRITPSSAARQKRAVLGAISAQEETAAEERIAAGRQATDIEVGEREAAAEEFGALGRAESEAAKLNIQQQKNIIDERFKAGTLGRELSKQDLDAKKAITDVMTNESLGLND